MNRTKQTPPKVTGSDGADNPFTAAPAAAPIMVPLASLRPHPRNYNAHSATQIDRIAQSLKTFGQRKPITTWRGYILTGHGVYAAAQQLGWTELEIKPCPEDWTEAQALRWLVADNEHAKRADPDQAALAALLQELGQGEDALLAAMGYDAAELAALLAGLAVPGTGDAEPQVDRAGELLEVWKVKPGDMWALGEHRLICGDCTDAAIVARVMGGEKAEMVWTYPPYGVAVGDKNKYLNSIAPSNRVEENLQNDTLDEPELVAMLRAAFDNAMAHCTAGAAWYVAAPPGPLHLLFGQVLKERGIWRQTIQWVKNNSTFSPLGVCYHWQAEPIFFGWLPDGGHRFYGGRTQTTVWEIDRPLASPEHPTMKPVALVARAVENSSRLGEIAYDPFLGSGTTLIACEQLGRKCRACEVAPGYVAVCLQRFVDAFSIAPVLLDPAP